MRTYQLRVYFREMPNKRYRCESCYLLLIKNVMDVEMNEYDMETVNCITVTS